MAEEFKIGDRVLYKDIGRERDLKGTVTGIARDKEGKITGYTVKLDEHYEYWTPKDLLLYQLNKLKE